jgi:hypothetical protein
VNDKAGNEALEAEIARRITEFDPVALLDLLHSMGYGDEEILFESRLTSTSQPAMIQAIDFKTQPIKQVVLSFNLGLLGPQSPLPSYFAKLMDDSDLDEQGLLEFLRFFDHKLIEGVVNSFYPERDTTVFRDWEGTKRSYLRLLGIRSITTVQWLFEATFPELGVKVERGTLLRNVKLEGTRLGFSILGGGAVLGGYSRVPVPGFTITMYCDEEHTEFGRPWAEEVRRRLDSIIFPAVAETAIDIRVLLVIRSEKVWAALKPTSYLGFDRIKGGSNRNRVVQVWQGQVTPALLLKKERTRTIKKTVAVAAR